MGHAFINRSARQSFVTVSLAAILLTGFAAGLGSAGEPADSAIPAASLESEATLAVIKHAGCMSCHMPDEARVGPSFRSIAQMYPAPDEATREVLARKIILGGAGKWGTVPMIANPRLSHEQSRAIVDWIVALDPEGGPAPAAATGK